MSSFVRAAVALATAPEVHTDPCEKPASAGFTFEPQPDNGHFAKLQNGMNVYEVPGSEGVFIIFDMRRNPRSNRSSVVKKKKLPLLTQKVFQEHGVTKESIARLITTWNLLADTPHAVKIIDRWVESESEDGQVHYTFYLQMELCDHNLFQFMVQDKWGDLGDLPTPQYQSEILSILLGIVEVVKQCHEGGGLHRDLQLRNCYVKDGVGKVGGFGKARLMQPHDDTQMTPEKKPQEPFSPAPEQLANERGLADYGPSIDTYYLGFVAISGILKIDDHDKQISELRGEVVPRGRGLGIANKKELKFTDPIWERLGAFPFQRTIKELLMHMIAPQPEARPSLEHVKLVLDALHKALKAEIAGEAAVNPAMFREAYSELGNLLEKGNATPAFMGGMLKVFANGAVAKKDTPPDAKKQKIT